ncbi:MAG: hypothetical protein HY820_06820 [Acidobacteria bacterium]|nr:hypothetical protein [Acidobacteriota bacterium]
MAAGGAAVAAMIQAVKASGVIVRVEPGEFQKLLRREANPLVVTATGGLFSRNYQYLFSHKGLAFYTKSAEQLTLPRETELVNASRIWIPG